MPRQTRSQGPVPIPPPLPTHGNAGYKVSYDDVPINPETGYFDGFRCSKPHAAFLSKAHGELDAFEKGHGVGVYIDFAPHPSTESDRLSEGAEEEYDNHDHDGLQLHAMPSALIGFPNSESRPSGLLKRGDCVLDTWIKLKAYVQPRSIRATLRSITGLSNGNQHNLSLLANTPILPQGITWIDDESEESWHLGTHILFVDNIAIALTLANKRNDKFIENIEKRHKHLNRMVSRAGAGRWGVDSNGSHSVLRKGHAEGDDFKFLRK
ncbi:hypothetical protein JCM10908_000980 [Rhodotorula pacifica]|uniref:uncharacterized protein n=1 Tax=Rhodotorula pacifica TaxID=1495444 RepID=UPI003170D6EE